MVASGQSPVLEYSPIVLSVLIFIMTGCDCQEPCLAPIRINDPWRDVTVVNNKAKGENCDKNNFFPNSWYSFEIDNQAAMIPTTCVQSHRCGTTIGMRIDLEGQAMPELGEYVNASLCGSYNILGSYDCCVLRSPVTIFKCKNNEYVYKFLSPIDRCPAAICTQKNHEEVPKEATALMGDPHPDRLNSTVSGNDEEVSDNENPPEDIMIQEDENRFEIGNSTQQQRGINETQFPSPIPTDSNPPQQNESVITGITQDGISPTNGDDVSNATSDDTSVISTTTSPETTVAPTIPNQLTLSSTADTLNTSTATATTEKAEDSTSPSIQDTSTKDHRSPMPITTNATAEAGQISKNNTLAVNTTSTTTKDDEIVTFNNSTGSSSRLDNSSSSSIPTSPPSTQQLVTVTASPSPSTTDLSTPSASTSTVSNMATTTISTIITTITTSAGVSSSPTTFPSTSSFSTTTTTSPSSSSSSSSSTQSTLSSSASASSNSSPSTASTDSGSSASLSPSPPPRSSLTTQSQSPTVAPSLSTAQSQSTTMASSPPATQPQYTSMSQSTPPTQSPDVTTQYTPLSTHEVLVIELVRFVFLGGFWDESFSQDVVTLLLSFLAKELSLRRAEEPDFDPWYEITTRETIVGDRNETTHLDTRIAHAWPEQMLYLFQRTDFADYLYDVGNLTLLVACRPSRLCQMDDDYVYNTIAPPNPSHKTPQPSSSSTFQRNLPVLIAVTTICAFCLVVMATGVLCAKCRKKRRSWNAGNDVEKKSLKDNRPDCQGTPSPFTDTQIMSDEEAADGSANGSAVDGGETMQDNSWVVPLEDIELDDIDKEVVAESTEDTKF